MKKLLLILAGVGLSVSSAHAQLAREDMSPRNLALFGDIGSDLLCMLELQSMVGEPDYNDMKAKCKQQKTTAMQKVTDAWSRQQAAQRKRLRNHYGTSANGH